MSKSRGNVVNPDDIVNEYGADTMRLYEMFIGDFEKAAPGIPLPLRAVSGSLTAFGIFTRCGGWRRLPPGLEAPIHRTIKKVTEDIDNLKANTANAAMMSLLNAIADTGAVTKGELRTLTLLLNPFAPHMTEELWEQMGFGGTVTDQQWPAYDEAKCKDETVEIVVQLNGKVRAKLSSRQRWRRLMRLRWQSRRRRSRQRLRICKS